MKVELRGKRYRAIGTLAGKFLRLSLGTANHSAASTATHRIERAMAEGACSSLWPELKRVLPPKTFAVLADLVGYREPATVKVWTWNELLASYEVEMRQRLLLGKLAGSTWSRYQHTLKAFGSFLLETGVHDLPQMGRPFIDKFKLWRLGQIQTRKSARGGTSLVLDVAILHQVFAIGIESEMIVKNPVRLDSRPGNGGDNGAQPFTGAELTRLRERAGGDLLAYLLLRWTGFRGSDAVGLTWQEIDWQAREINRLTQKRKKRVLVPIPAELVFALETERDLRSPQAHERVLVNRDVRARGAAMTRRRLYDRMLALGRRAGVANAHPHRYRDTFAVDMLARGASPYDVAKLLGDTVATVEKHYAPFVKELRERARRLMENGEGLEKTDCTKIAQSEARTERIH